MATADFTGLGILIVEDEPLLRKRLASRLQAAGADVSQADNLQTAQNLLAALSHDYVLLDVHLPDGSGLQLLREPAFPPNTGVIVMTAHGAIAGAVEAMKLGALDYLVKPFEPAQLALVLERAQRSRQSARVEQHRREGEETFFFGQALSPILGQLDKILAADHRLQTNLPPVLIQGETGTGKSALARWLHQHGPRAKAELVEVNCSTLPETLAESELFGHERGAFTDARTARLGLLEAAHGGTLFLDELPSLSLGLQAKTLTAIEDHRIRRVGGNRAIPVDVRIIAATNRDLKELVGEGQFREDLFHRLDLYRINVPPLRDRGLDIVALAEQLVRQICHRHRLPQKKISRLGAHALLSHPWPGNVRELAHELERAIVFEDAEELNLFQLGPGPGSASSGLALETDSLNQVLDAEGFSLEGAIDRFIQLALEKTGGNVSAAARLLQVPRDYVRYRLGQKGPRPRGK